TTFLQQKWSRPLLPTFHFRFQFRDDRAIDLPPGLLCAVGEAAFVNVGPAQPNRITAPHTGPHVEHYATPDHASELRQRYVNLSWCPRLVPAILRVRLHALGQTVFDVITDASPCRK